MTAQTYNMIIKQGETFNVSIVWNGPSGTPNNMTGGSARMQFRDNQDPTSIILDANTAVPVTGVTFGALDTTGTISITLSAAFTSSLAFNGARYDLFATNGTGATSALLEGHVTLDQAVTH